MKLLLYENRKYILIVKKGTLHKYMPYNGLETKEFTPLISTYKWALSGQPTKLKWG